MVKTCAVHGCKNRFKRRTAEGGRISFHEFPKDLEKSQKWIDAVGREDLTLGRVCRSNGFTICSQHFLEDDFFPYGARRKLQYFAVPSVFPTHTVPRSTQEPGCAAFHCFYNTFRGIPRTNIPLHAFPKDPARKRQWAIAIRRKADDGGLWMPTNASEICSLHFPEEDLDRTGQTVRLREGVTPSRFDYGEEGTRRGKRRLLSQKELDEILAKQYQQHHGITENSQPSQSSAPRPPSDPAPAIRSLRLRQALVRKSLLSKRFGRSRVRSFAKKKYDNLDHQYPRLRSDSPLSADDDRRDTGDVSSPKPQTPLSPLSLPPPPSHPRTVPDQLQLPAGRLTRYLACMKYKQNQLHLMKQTYFTLQDKIRFRNAHPDWLSDRTPERTLAPPLLTLRGELTDKAPALPEVEALTGDTLLPMTPTRAWNAVAALREQVLNLQLALMNTRIEVLDGDMRLQEAKAIHRRYKANVKEERKQAELNRKTTIREVEKRVYEPCKVCPALKRKLAVTERATKKKLRRAETLSKRLEQVFTPMQMRVFRTGKSPRWAEEDIRRAIKLKMYVSHRAYSHIRLAMRIPLPTTFIIGRSIKRFTSLQPLYDAMLAENEKKVRKPKAGKDGHSSAVQKRKMCVVSNFHDQELLAVERPLVKRQKKRPPLQPHGYSVEAVSREEVVKTDASATSYRDRIAAGTPYRDRTAGQEGKAGGAKSSWAKRLPDWEVDEESVDQETLEELTSLRATRDDRSWSWSVSELR